MKSVYKYEGLDEQELPFPIDAYIRLLRKNIKKKKFDDEQWYEGAYDNRIGYFPSIFVEELFNWSNENKYLESKIKEDSATCNDDTTINYGDADKTMLESEKNDLSYLISPGIETNQARNEENINSNLSPLSDYQKVPHK